ncbi:MAG TPA: 4a-hydroxytetrahydrobiopterin dehydratase [Planctomycetota bacterium]|nr:4a-hydroxytetrahydrobiopterin dehydratase [Planctomycetota bacterium]
MKLAEQHCRALGKETPPLAGPELGTLLAQIEPAWRIHSGPLLVRRIESKQYPQLVALAGRIGALAQAEDHHPDMELGYGKLEVALSTHSVGGLSMNDFVLAARIDQLARESSF